MLTAAAMMATSIDNVGCIDTNRKDDLLVEEIVSISVRFTQISSSTIPRGFHVYSYEQLHDYDLIRIYTLSRRLKRLYV